MTATWTSAPAAVNAQTGAVITRTGIRANHINENGNSVSVGEGSLQPQLSEFSYDWPSDTITAKVGTTSGFVPLRVFVNGAVTSTVNWQINVTNVAQWDGAPPAATGLPNSNITVSNIIANHASANGQAGLTVDVAGAAVSFVSYTNDDLVVQLLSSGTVTLQLKDNTGTIVDTVSWSVTVNSSTAGVSTKTATNNSAFHAYQWMFMWWWTNLFNASANGGGAPNGVDVTIELPISGAPSTLPDFTGNFQNNGLSVDADGNPLPVKVRFKGNFTNTGAVRGYPAGGIGSPAGSFETYGVITGATLPLMAGFRNNASQENTGAGNAFPIFDLQVAQDAVGYPAFAGSLPDSKIVLEASSTGSPATYNIFNDTYWHDVSDPDLLPTTDEQGNNHIASLLNTINGISGRDTRMWNLNFWHEGPTAFNGTGGVLIASNLQIESGKPVSIYVKHETGGGNNFFYLAFFYDSPPADHIVDYNAYAKWVMATTTGAGTFLTEVYNHAASQAIITKMANPDPYSYFNGTQNVTNTPAPKTVRPPDALMVVDSLQSGCEMWGTNAGGEAEITFHQLGFIIDGVEFGIITDTSVVVVENETFDDWLEDPANDCNRLYLVEIDHSGGTLRFASKAWLSDEHQPYDDWLIDTPFLQYSMSDYGATGDVEAHNGEPGELNWLQLSFHGHKSRSYFGDDRWQKRDFRIISTETNQGIRRTGTNRFVFDLISEGNKYNRTFHDAAVTIDNTVSGALDQIFGYANSNPEYEIGSYVLKGVSSSVPLLFDINENSNLEAVIRRIALSLNAYPRITQAGELEIISRTFADIVVHEFDGFQIENNSLDVVQTIDPVASVTVRYNNGNNDVSLATEAQIGIINTDRSIDSVLKNQADALELARVESERNNREQRVWRYDTQGNAETIDMGDAALITHPELSSYGIISDVIRQPLLDISTIEVTI